MPIFKLSEKKDKSNRVVSGIRLTGSRYIDPNTAKIDVKSLKKEESEPVVQGAPEYEEASEVISLPEEVPPAELVEVAPEMEYEEASEVISLPEELPPAEPVEVASGMEPEARRVKPPAPVPVPAPPPSMPKKETPEKASLPEEPPLNLPSASDTKPPAGTPDDERGNLEIKEQVSPSGTDTNKPAPSCGEMPIGKKPLGAFGKRPLGMRPPLSRIGKPKPMAPGGAGIKPPGKAQEPGADKPDNLTPAPAEEVKEQSLDMPASITPAASEKTAEAPKAGDSQDHPTLTGLEQKDEGSAATKGKADIPGESEQSASPVESPAAEPESNKPKPVFGKMPLGKKPVMQFGKKPLGAFGKRPLGIRPPLSQIGRPKPITPGGAGFKPDTPETSVAAAAEPEKLQIRPPLAVEPGDVGIQTLRAPSPTPATAKPPSQELKAPTKPDKADELIAPTAVIPAYERAGKIVEDSSKSVRPKAAAPSLYCFVKIAGTWKRKHFLSAQRGIRIGGADSINEITLNDNSLDNEHAVIVESPEKWVAMDIGSKDMMRVDGTASRQVSLSLNLPYVLQLGSESVVVFLASAGGGAPELIPPEKKPGIPPGASKINKLKFGEKEFPVFIPDKLPPGENKEINNLGSPCFTLTPTNDPEKVLQAIKVPAGSPPMLVGRSGKLSQLLVPDKNVSRRHAEIAVSGKRLTLKDCGTSNGTYVNFTEISEPTAVKAGDTVTFGSIPFFVAYE